MKLERIRAYTSRAGKEALAVAEAGFLTFSDPKISWRQKSLLLGALVYLLSPIDGIPDLLPGGFSDDVSLLLAALMAAGQVGQIHLKQCRIKYGLTQAEAPKEPS